jgi:F-type H+-transporting ATPase subunit epsilon
MSILCEIVTQERIVFQGEADMVSLPGEDGQISILPEHSPLLTVLKYGIIRVQLAEDEKVFAVFGGLAEIQPQLVTVLADAAESLNEINEQKVEEAKRQAERKLKKKRRFTADEELEIWDALRRSNVRLEALRRYQHNRD